MVGDFTEGQARKARKMHQIRSGVVREMFDFYKSYNVLYERVFLRDDVLDEDYPDDFVDRYFFEHVEDNGNAYNDSMDVEQKHIRGHADVGCVEGDEDEESILERHISLMDDASPVMASAHPLTREPSPECKGAQRVGSAPQTVHKSGNHGTQSNHRTFSDDEYLTTGGSPSEECISEGPRPLHP
ncbi:hypothetical protein V7S43_014392 [Phytophthora oleae]|uniref:Uncharacterized protein n=1 Tax=Phytophthora oleae TaxID=2107226 RepID=A0ABD3F3R4_9STRA